MPAYVLFMGLLLVVLAGAVGYALGRSAGTRASSARTVDAVRREITALRALVANLKDTAWDHREATPTCPRSSSTRSAPTRRRPE